MFDITANADMHALDRFGRAVLKIDYEFGNGTVLRSVTGYQEGQSEYRADLDGTSAGNNIFGDLVDETIFSQEINLISSDAGKFKWILGAYYQDDEIDFPPGEFYIGIPRRLLPARWHEPEGGLGGVRPGRASKLPDRFELQVGARYSDHKTDQPHQRQSVRPAAHAGSVGRRSRTPPARWR